MDIGNVEAFCYGFGHRIQQISTSQTIFCIIDGIKFYEGQGSSWKKRHFDFIGWITMNSEKLTKAHTRGQVKCNALYHT